MLPSEKEQQANPIDLPSCAPKNSRYDSQIAVFGAALHEKLQNQRYFVVGAGAIGCELLKNFALMGLGTGEAGGVEVTDMDSIERSNLNRQFLFRESDVGSLKSVSAARAAQQMNPALKVRAHSVRVSPQTEDTFDDAFWEGLSGCVTALDNVEARIYVDQRCIYYQRPLVDSGTLGTKGSTQVIVPFLTESYGSTRDAPEDSIPLCTLKSFPWRIEHTIQWARDHFEGLFKAGPSEANSYLSQREAYLAELAKQQNVQISTLTSVKQLLVDERPRSFDDCVRWARLLWEQEYNHNIAQLLHQFPADSRTPEGHEFWSGTKRAPKVLTFDPSDDTHMAFIVAAANLRAYNFGLPQSRDVAAIRAAAQSVQVPPFVPQQNAKIATSEAEAKEMLEQVEDDHEAKVQALTAALPDPAALGDFALRPIEFEKDDASNFHMDFVTACSNLRARNYSIAESDLHETKRIAGKIIPAIATTTALVTGMVCMEVYKLLQPSKNKIEDFRCFSCNLALPMFSSSEPLPPAKSKAALKDGVWEWSLWDRIDVDIGDVTLEQLMQHFQDKYGVEVTMLSHGASMLFYNFGVALKKKVKDRLKEKVSDLVKTVGGAELGPNTKYIVLEACVQNEEEEEIEIPFVRFKFR